MFFKKFIGNKNFYKAVAVIVLPIILQNALNNIVNFVDSVMLGQIEETYMNGVSIVNRLILVFSLCVFGATAGAGIFTAQYFGSKNYDGVRQTIIFKFYISIIISAIFGLIFGLFGEKLIEAFLREGDETVVRETLKYAKAYFIIAIFAQIPNSITQVYANTLRETKQTLVPMLASLCAVVTNCLLNWILIFGKLGLPALGVKGAAIATLISRIVECAFLIIYAHSHTKKLPYFKGLFSHLKLSGDMISKCTKKSLSLLLNESLWAIIQAILLSFYVIRGDATRTAMTIASSVHDVFCIFFISLANGIGIMVGNLLGAGKIEEAKDTDNKIMALAMLTSIVLAIILASFSPLIVKIYNIPEDRRILTNQFLLAVSLFMPLHSFIHCCYFTLRAGGKALLTFLFDSLFSSLVCLPLAYILVKFTTLSSPVLFLIVGSVDIIKAVIGFIFLKKGIWLNNIVNEENKKQEIAENNAQ